MPPVMTTFIGDVGRVTDMEYSSTKLVLQQLLSCLVMVLVPRIKIFAKSRIKIHWSAGFLRDDDFEIGKNLSRD